MKSAIDENDEVEKNVLVDLDEQIDNDVVVVVIMI